MQSVQVRNHYHAWRYTDKARFTSFWHQIDEIIQLGPSTVLEIGVGSGFLQQYLAHIKIDSVALDIAYELSPDCVASSDSLPFQDRAFDVSVCYQVLEHMPYDQALATLREMHRVTRRAAIISLPDANSLVRLSLTASRIRLRYFKSLRLRLRTKPLVKDHFWEIGMGGYSVRGLTHDIENCGFTVVKTYRVFEHPYHRFFILNKSAE